MNRWFSTVSTASTVVLSGGAIALLQLPRLDQVTDSVDTIPQAILEQQIEQEESRLALWKQLPAVGFNNMAANVSFLSFLQYFGDDEVRMRTNYALSPEFFEVILKKDPYFWDAYLFLPGSTTMYAAQPERTVEIMETYLPQLSPKAPDRAYYIWRWKATDELLFLDDPESAIDSYQMAANWASEYDTEEGKFITQNSQQTVHFLEENPASKAVQVSAWMTVYSNAFDFPTQQLALERIRGLGGRVILDEEGRVQEVIAPRE